ncbi:unnamed protein product, partial [Musa hybrid cultivar]
CCVFASASSTSGSSSAAAAMGMVVPNSLMAGSPGSDMFSAPSDRFPRGNRRASPPS